ncbi:MAG: hypothetical protein WC522_02665 [Candidatus Omnitrophota bacterium]
MSFQRILKPVLAATFVLAVLSPRLFAAEPGETEKMLRRITPPISVIKEMEVEAKPKDQWYFDSFYEPSLILQGNKTGRWGELTNTFGYAHQNIQGYFSVSEYDRFGNNDYNANFGSYINMKNSYLRLESGFGWNVNYTYDFQAIGEYAHKLIKDVFWQVGYNYRMYRTSGDSHNVYPGLIYYFGGHYIAANYGIGWIESRDDAHFGVIKGDFKITDFLRLSGGTAFGERLYDIFGRHAHSETGYIVFSGLSLNLYKGITCRVGCSYGTEKPKFIKRSLNFGLNFKF